MYPPNTINFCSSSLLRSLALLRGTGEALERADFLLDILFRFLSSDPCDPCE